MVVMSFFKRKIEAYLHSFYHGKFRCDCPNPLLRVLPFLGLRRRVPLQGVRRLPRPALPIPSSSSSPPQLSMRRRARALPRPGLLGCAMHKGMGLAYPILLAVEAALLSRACTRSSSFFRASEGPRALPGLSSAYKLSSQILRSR